MRYYRFLGLLFFLIFKPDIILATPSSEQNLIDYFKNNCEKVGNEIWGTSLCSKVIIINKETGEVFKSHPNSSPIPPMRANTSFDWNGENWLMILAPLPSDETKQKALIFHEAWHTKQQKLGFTSDVGALPSHFDEIMGRYYLFLEWRALEKALESKNSARKIALGNALWARNMRFEIFKNARMTETSLMLHEGLAEYTGIKSQKNSGKKILIENLKNAESRKGLARSFAYISGPTYGLLLDDYDKEWAKNLKPGVDFIQQLPIAPIPIMNNKYSSDDLLKQIKTEFDKNKEIKDKIINSLLPQNALELPLINMSMDFDPNQVIVDEKLGTIYQKITIRDSWGSIEVNNSALLISQDFSKIYVPWPIDDKIKLNLIDGYEISKIENRNFVRKKSN